MITDEKMEKLIAELYEESIQEMEVPVDIDVEAHLDRAYRELEAKEKEEAAAARKKKFKSVIRAAVVFIGILVVSIVAFEPEQGYADVFRFMFDRDARGNEVISDNLIGEETVEEIEESTVSLEELDKLIGEPVPIPKYMPYEYEAKTGAKIIKGYDKVLSIQISYTNKETWKMIIYNIMPAEEKRVTSIVMDIPEEKIEEIMINESLCYLYSDAEKEKMTIYWETNEYLYSIDGNISREEVIKIVESIK
ncbi:MAG: DUF4367 domain-containing protein [Clostridiales bacterium]|nr:DUF4367 domain-containing protein [Clostridiales bacterium]